MDASKLIIALSLGLAISACARVEDQTVRTSGHEMTFTQQMRQHTANQATVRDLGDGVKMVVYRVGSKECVRITQDEKLPTVTCD